MGRKRGVRKICSLEGCSGFHYAKGLCKKHYHYNYYHFKPGKKQEEMESVLSVSIENQQAEA
ncbi:hypothetical protein [Paenibacillus eucommiae]|uniref:Vegetative protein n=1 Tax=Paenibacillus eucommiae TaxID=1355755 RepID=A0ABS4JCW1_9BACL|nr:hypothetical protein [Paenibacillus eucommiae]MBP1996569.1 hypothetical protein [Paenibacillus eucommiae]